MTINRTALFVGVSLAAMGTAVLVGLGEGAASDTIRQAVRLWPLAIIALGAGLLARRTRFAVAGTITAAMLAGLVLGGAVVAAPKFDSICGDRGSAAAQTRHGTFAGPSRVDLSFACGDVTVSTIEGSGWELRTQDLGGSSARVDQADDELVVRSVKDRWNLGLARGGDEWHVGIPTDVTVDLDAEIDAGRGRLELRDAVIGDLALEVNAGDARLDLTDATVDRLDVRVSAGSATVLLSLVADLTGALTVSAGAIEICAPADLGVRVHGDAEFGATEFNGLLRVGDAWETPDLSTATHLAELSVSARAGSVVVNPAGGCK